MILDTPYFVREYRRHLEELSERRTPDMKEAIDCAMRSGLTLREVRILHERYWLCKTRQRISEEEGLPKNVVQLIERKALWKLRHPNRTKLLMGFTDFGQ